MNILLSWTSVQLSPHSLTLLCLFFFCCCICFGLRRCEAAAEAAQARATNNQPSRQYQLHITLIKLNSLLFCYTSQKTASKTTSGSRQRAQLQMLVTLLGTPRYRQYSPAVSPPSRRWWCSDFRGFMRFVLLRYEDRHFCYLTSETCWHRWDKIMQTHSVIRLCFTLILSDDDDFVSQLPVSHLTICCFPAGRGREETFLWHKVMWLNVRESLS